MNFISSHPTTSLRTLIVLFCCILMLSAPAGAGDRDTHLTATHFLGRHAGLSDEEARIIASANWSMDRNNNTTAWGVEWWEGRTQVGRTQQGVAAHQLGKPNLAAAIQPDVAMALGLWKPDTKTALAQLSALKSDVQAAIDNGDRLTADRRLGQYLHALQDSFFHQTNAGVPYEGGRGHAGYPADEVAANLESSARAYQATYSTLQAFKDGTPLPDPGSFDIYHPHDGTNRLLQPGAVSPTALRLAVATAKAYTFEERGLVDGNPLEPYQVTYKHDHPDPSLLNDNLKNLWNSLHKDDSTFNPALKLKGEEIANFPATGGEVEKTNFRTHPDWLSPTLFGPLTGLPVDVKDGTVRSKGDAAPGGISISGAAALALPIDIDLDAVHYDPATNAVILTGPNSRHDHSFDASILMTSLRLACEPSDPYFSLDPVDNRSYTEQSQRAFEDLAAFAKSHFRPVAEHFGEGTFLDQVRGVRIYGPEFEAYSIQKQDRQAYETFLQRYPALRPRLVFRPAWLRETRLGEILYRADVMLKELQTGLAVLDIDHEAPVKGVPGYVSADTRSSAAQLLEILQHEPVQMEKATGWRLWFDLAESDSTPLHSPKVAPLNSVSGSSGINAEIAGRIEKMLNGKKLFGSPVVASESVVARLAENQKILDLSQVFPKMFVRRHEKGQDLPGSDPYLDQVTADVNSRLASYATQYRELRDLIQVFRAYVAARKIIEQYPGGCRALQDFPLLPSEKLQKPLPAEHPTPLIAVQLATVGMKDAQGERVVSAIVHSLNGGVGLNYRLLPSSTQAPTMLINQVQSGLQERSPSDLVWHVPDNGSGQPVRQFISLRFDVDDAIHSQLQPVTMATLIPDLDRQLDQVLEKLDMLQVQQQNQSLNSTNRRLKNYVAILFALLSIMGSANVLLFMRARTKRSFRVPKSGLSSSSSSGSESSMYY